MVGAWRYAAAPMHGENVFVCKGCFVIRTSARAHQLCVTGVLTAHVLLQAGSSAGERLETVASGMSADEGEDHHQDHHSARSQPPTWLQVVQPSQCHTHPCMTDMYKVLGFRPQTSGDWCRKRSKAGVLAHSRWSCRLRGCMS